MTIIEVGPRDGLQNEKIPIPTDVKLRFIGQLAAAGLSEIEATSFVSPKWVPQLGDAAELWPQLPTGPSYSALVPNIKGLERALSVGVRRISVFTAASDAFTQKNINMTVEQSLDVFHEVIRAFEAAEDEDHDEVHSPRSVRGYVSTAFECPYAGRMDPGKVASVVDRLFEMGVDEVSIGDTIGVAAPTEVRALAKALEGRPKERIAWHFHDTRGTAIANASAALDLGFERFDSSAAGLGGCPYAPGAGGNLATEDLVYFLERSGLATGIDLDRLSKSTQEVLALLGRAATSKAALASLAAGESGCAT